MDGARADRRAGHGVAAVHLHRLRADVRPGRRRRLPVPPAGRGGGVRHDRLLRAVAHAGADAGQLSAGRTGSTAPARPGASGRRRAATRWSAFSAASNAGSNSSARGYRSLLGLALAGALDASSPGSSPSCCCPSGWCRSSARISSRRSRPARSSCMCARRPARGSRRPPRLCDQVEAAIRARSSRRMISTPSSTISACRSAASTWPTAIPARSASRTPTS